jgi:hypothetical protein
MWKSQPKTKDHVKMGLTEIGREGVDMIYSAQNKAQWHALVNMATKL